MPDRGARDAGALAAALAQETPCACRTRRTGEFSPDTGVEQGAYSLVARVVHAAEHYTHWQVRCTTCGQLWMVEDDQSYWKTLYQWKAVSG